MYVTITVKAEAESEQELVEHLGDHVAVLRQHFDQLREEDAFGPKAHIAPVRYLVIGGSWREPKAENNGAEEN